MLARHGETEWNTVGRRQGRLDSALTTAGQAHASQIAELAAGLGCDAIFASPLGRAQATAAIAAEELSLTVQTLEELAEVDHGVFGGMTNQEIDSEHPGWRARRDAEKFTVPFPGGESYEHALVRSRLAIARAAATGSGSPLIVSHEMISRMLMLAMGELNQGDALRWRLRHGTIAVIEPG